MIGNDVVDLWCAERESNWRRRGYLSKIFTNGEQALIHNANNPDEMVWLLWSMKESAYKIHNRLTGERKFAPSKLVCTVLNRQDNELTGEVLSEGINYFTDSKITSAYVHTIAAITRVMLPEIKTVIYETPAMPINYRSTKPKCISHHGRYLALVY